LVLACPEDAERATRERRRSDRADPPIASWSSPSSAPSLPLRTVPM
jgi:hypothetical protein